MGEVYRARDARLKRDVAIKLLRPEFSRDEQRLARFRREAEILALLNHPHIATIYDLDHFEGSQFLVLELVEGETLAERIERGRISIDEALSIARQIVDAVEAAHEEGIIHRDLKPSNIKVSSDHTVKVLDFGLAKAWDTRQNKGYLSDAPTLTSTSIPGMILGTPAYMSPEQARGEETGRTTDIWAFGCVLYEMLTGSAVFKGPTTAEVLAEVIKADPDWNRLPPETPAPIRRLLRRCLQKDQKKRLQCIGDARLELADALNPEAEVAFPAHRASRREKFAWVAVAIAVVIAILAGARAFRMQAALPEMRVDVDTPPGSDLTSLALSPDGLKIAFVSGSNSSLWLRSLQSGEARPLAGTEGAAFPFWSSESRSIGFFAGGKLKRIDVASGLINTLTDSAGRGGTWNADDVILFAPGSNTPIFKISAGGGQPLPVTRLKAQQGTHRQPHFLPDGHHFLFWGQDGGTETRAVYAGDLDGSEPRRILDSDTAAVYSPGGQLLFFRDGRLFAQPFDAAGLTLRGTPALLADQVLSNRGFNIAAISSSAAGPIAYRTGNAGERQFIWFDRSGKEIQRIGTSDNALPLGASLSPDTRRVALERTVNGNIDVWFMETARGVLSRFTSDPQRQRWPQWSPDGSRVVFAQNTTGTYDLYVRSVNDGAPGQLLLKTPDSKAATDWSADGRFLLYKSQTAKTGMDLWALALTEPPQQIAVAQTEFDEGNGQFSPDVNWIAYESNESGRFEIYLQSFPGPGHKIQVSPKGGTQPRWRRDGQALFYIAPDGRITEVPLRFSADRKAVEAATPVALFTTHIVGPGQPQELQEYAVSPDGERFLLNAVTQEPSNSPITVILNWKPGN